MSNKEESEYQATIIARVTYKQKMYLEKNFDTISEGVRQLIEEDIYNV